MKQFAIIDHGINGLLQQRQSLILNQASPDLHDKIRNINLAGTDNGAGTALDAEPLDIFRLFQFVKPGGQDRADAAGIDLAEHVAPDKTENGADVEARSATNALQCLLELWIGRHLGAAVIHQDNVHILHRTIIVRRRTGDD